MMISQFDSQTPIIFTDESTVEVDLSRGGLWRKRGHQIPESYFVHNAHPIHVMIWGGIGPNGYRTPLIRCPASVTGASYVQFLTGAGIFAELNNIFGIGRYVFQQDNATPHTSVKDIIGQYARLIDWPAKSPDLSPIEQIWAYLKHMIRGTAFTSAEALFQALVKAWQEMPNEIVCHCYESFHARCEICRRYGGQSLNGHWKEVHNLHHNIV
jgi:hypothetical protein